MIYAGISLLLVVLIVVLMLVAVHIGCCAPRRVERCSPADFKLVYEEVRIRSVDGRRLFACWLPVADSAPATVILHGWDGNAGFMLPLARPLCRAGLNVLLLDARNHGRSDAAGLHGEKCGLSDIR